MPFDPAFDMPSTAAEAVAVLVSWGSPSCMTFSAERAAKCAVLILAAYPELHQYENRLPVHRGLGMGADDVTYDPAKDPTRAGGNGGY